jgi:precorrin-4/cobalt-precorrin-4 C11-methyltransferase
MPSNLVPKQTAVPSWPSRRPGGDANPLSIYLTIHTLERLVQELVPFYGENCPIAVVYDDRSPASEIFHGTLASIATWAAAPSDRRPLRVFVG